MVFVWIALALLALMAAAVLAVSYICYRRAFYVQRGKNEPKEDYPLPVGDVYEPYWGKMVQWMKQLDTMPHETFTITSFDGLKLWGDYYEYAPGAPIELMFHGYRGSARRDLCGGVQRCFALGRSALIVDQRTSNRSEGKVISFGVNERRDCHSWLAFMQERFGPDIKIILTGVSMGAATVLMAASDPLPSNVVGILADAGYSSQKEIMKCVIREMKLPENLVYPFARLGARLFGHFDLEEITPEEAVKKCPVPVMFFHGEADDYVPCQMSRINYEACTAPKRICTIPGAGHCLSCLKDKERYFAELRAFFDPILT